MRRLVISTLCMPLVFVLAVAALSSGPSASPRPDARELTPDVHAIYQAAATAVVTSAIGAGEEAQKP